MNLPRVTSILSPYTDFSMVSEDTLAAAAERGTAVHEASAAYALGIWATVPEDLQGYFDSFRAWFDKYVREVIAVEEEIRHPRLGYVGHVDLIARISGYQKDRPVVAVVDYKTPLTASRTWRAQIAAYVEPCREKYGVEIGGDLQLRRDGGLPKMTWVEDQNQAFAAFMGALSAYNYINQGKP